ncbi:bifunctional DNA primase/polymerase [Streptomyces sp. ACA25]|uniref:bifunctional DNA primase/polymerase n=1 Tax=Streptomyces sp. ACA25 TaxID=3022596 RepID=UPI0023080E9D|nr:bifunctional DNA primase/polymerase [Streptomyces sp. ACA25]MDB1089634.1 bifunctional DNA primase/polymerase [Streptomyces sp. ACA25]
MGFTIGGMREIRELRLVPRIPRLRGRAPEGTAVAEYTGLWGWDVQPGTRIRRLAGGRAGCSCENAECPLPGAHPRNPALLIRAGSPLHEVAAAWERTPGATVLLPVGRTFDVIDVPGAAGHRALARLERLALPCGPVAVAPHGRAWFFVAPGAAAELTGLLYRAGWDGALLDLRGLGPGAHITAPPSDHAGLGPVRWLRPPDLETAARPPEARLLLGALAYACHRAGE